MNQRHPKEEKVTGCDITTGTVTPVWSNYGAVCARERLRIVMRSEETFMSANGCCRAEEEIPIDRRDRIRLLTAALATQVELGAVSRSPDNRSEHALDRAINLCEMQI